MHEAYKDCKTEQTPRSDNEHGTDFERYNVDNNPFNNVRNI